jgi:serine/threonine protein phosphatase PrpC
MADHVLQAVAWSGEGSKRKINEDAYMLQLVSPDHPQALFAVADGVSTLYGGDQASRIALDIIQNRFYQLSTDMRSRIEQAIQDANTAVREQAEAENVEKMGTTVAGFVLAPSGEMIVFNVGDSRVYRVRRNRLDQLSRDQVSIKTTGPLTERLPNKRNTKLSAYVGQPIPLHPVYYRQSAQWGDIYIICTDGLWSMLGADELSRTIRKYPVEQATEKLVDTVFERGAPDNLTVLVVRVGIARKNVLRLFLFFVLCLTAALILTLLLIYH